MNPEYAKSLEPNELWTARHLMKQMIKDLTSLIETHPDRDFFSKCLEEERQNQDILEAEASRRRTMATS